VHTFRGRVLVAVLVATALCCGPSWSRASAAQMPEKASALVGAWTMNHELSDTAQAEPSTPDRERPEGAGPRGGGGRGRGGRGGFGGGGRDGGSGGERNAPGRADAVARLRDAMRDVTNPPDHLTIVATDTMVIITRPDGRTTRLSPDGKKIKDENTNIEWKTKWDGARLVTEISGLGPGKVTETYSVDVERHQLHLVADMEGGGGKTRTFSHVYDLDAR